MKQAYECLACRRVFEFDKSPSKKSKQCPECRKRTLVKINKEVFNWRVMSYVNI
jgi:DNA-directed RNA polymerase subunit RPC12/RpoP